MKIKVIALGVLFLAVGAVLTAFKAQLEETVVSARYEMLACEGCSHMRVEKSSNSSLEGKTIIPISSAVNVEQMIDSIALTKEPLCLSGKPYRFNWNLLGINPDSIRFYVTVKESPEVCSSL